MSGLHIGIDASRVDVARRTGTERYSYELIHHLAELDHPHRIDLYLRSAAPLLPPLPASFRPRRVRPARLWTHAGLSLELARRPPDVLLVPAHVVPLWHPRATVVTIHDLGYLFHPEAHTAARRLYLRLGTWFSVRTARRVIAVSHATGKDLREQLRVPAERIAVIPHGRDEGFQPVPEGEARAAVLARHGVRPPYLLYLGTVQPRKNLARLLAAFARVRRGGAPHQLVVAGKMGWLPGEIMEALEREGVGADVRFAGYVPDPDLPALLSGADAFVLPSLYEGFGMPVIEAMACGVPVVVSNRGALPEVAGDAAVVVDPFDVEGMAEAMLALLADPARQDRLRQAGLARSRFFSWRQCAEQTLAVLEAAAGVFPRSPAVC